MRGFSDASEKAFGACIFLKSTNLEGKHFINLLCAKTKVAPLKTKTLPRLELAGAAILANLAQKVTKSLRLNISKRVFWTDSTIVLGWLKQPPNRLKTFVSNRVAQIQELTSNDTWRHVSSKNNPADILSRGIMPNELKTSQLWWHGPAFLAGIESTWPCTHDNLSNVLLPDIKSTTNYFMSENDDDYIFNKVSKLNKLKRIVAWILRFVHNAKSNSTKQKHCGSLSVDEINCAFSYLIKLSQMQSFSSEIKDLKNKLPISKRSKILNLNTFLDDNNVLRLRGRLSQSNYSYDKKHPVLLCAKHKLSKLLLEHEHLKLLHTGAQQLLASISEQYWIVSGRALAKRVVRECVICFRHNSKIVLLYPRK